MEEAQAIAKERFKDRLKRFEFVFEWTKMLFKYKAALDNQCLRTLGFDKPDFAALATRISLNRKSDAAEQTQDRMAAAIRRYPHGDRKSQNFRSPAVR